ncbi:hypothetical protein DES52_11682 [Deinococcus yavapaiensis KR-236]|uniref:Uncharacterized protein n=2 Tax=Deinococcus TaxID=1298 RepID=A0A318S121_9DEIO|nr:hypothetical protein DES52_11682 [Deinococcus yavapaiensis KR-236]
MSSTLFTLRFRALLEELYPQARPTSTLTVRVQHVNLVAPPSPEGKCASAPLATLLLAPLEIDETQSRRRAR